MSKTVSLGTQEILLQLGFTWRQVWFAIQTAFLQEFLHMMRLNFNAFKKEATDFL